MNHFNAKPRKNAPVGSHLLLTASPGYFRPENPNDVGRWNADSLDTWVCVLADRGQRVTQRAGTGDMMDVLFGTPKERRRLAPKIHSTGDRWIWNGEVEWTLGSILAPIKPNIADPSTYRNGKCRLGPDRRYCLSFVWQREDARYMIGGGYCQDMVKGEQPDPLEMLSALELKMRTDTLSLADPFYRSGE